MLSFIMYLEMWSGLLPPGVNESDVDTSSDDEGTWDGPGPESILKEKREQKDLKGVLSSGSEIQEPESITEGNPFTAVADEGQEFQTCPSGVSLDMWKVGMITTLHMTDTVFGVVALVADVYVGNHF